MRSHAKYLLLLTLIGLILTRSLWATGSVPDTHDGVYHTIRLAEYSEMVKSGQFPVRWANNLDGGYGLPLFNYVYPLPYLLGAPLILAGLSPFWTLKAVTVGAYLLGVWGIYLLFRRDQLTAFAASVLYLTAPYQLLNIFVRGALGEILAIGLIPWVLVAAASLKKQQLRWYHPIPYAFLFLSHNFLSILFLPVYLTLTLDRQSWAKVLLSLIFSAALSAWYLLPAFGEAGLVQSFAGSDFTFVLRDHFIYPMQLLWSQWGVGYSVAGTGDGMSFQLGVGPLLALALGIYYWHRRSRFALLVLAAAIFLMLPVSLPIWSILPPLQSVQFPWRLLFLPVVLIPHIYAGNLAGTTTRLKPAINLLVIAVALIFGVIFAQPRYPMNSAQYMAQWYANRYGTTTSARQELLPIYVRGDRSGEYLPRNYFPTWVWQDISSGAILRAQPATSGQIIPLDSSKYELVYWQTPLERLASGLSLAAIVILLILIFI